MKLPNSERARVDRRKIAEYLLNASHPDGASKAEFFGRFGFNIEDWQTLAEALRKHGRTYPVVRIVASAFGTRYTVDGELETPDGRTPHMRTVWVIEKDTEEPRLITAHPV